VLYIKLFSIEIEPKTDENEEFIRRFGEALSNGIL
jgi:hypothetical protein